MAATRKAAKTAAELPSPPSRPSSRCCDRWSRTCRRAARRIKLGGGEEKIAAQHEREKLTARERIALLIDDGTFVELGIHGRPHFSQRAMDGVEAPADGVITGYGKVERPPDGGVRVRLHGDGRLDGDDRRAQGHAPARAGADQADPVRVAARLRRRARPGGGGRDVRRLRAPVPRGGRDERRDPAGRGADGAVRGRHRLHPRPRRLRADGQGPRLDGARRARTSCARRSARTSPRRNSAARACTAASRASATWRWPDDEECIERIKQYLVVHAAELRRAGRRSVPVERPDRPRARRSCSTCCRSPTASRTTCTR